jgi:hypothetical protein
MWPFTSKNNAKDDDYRKRRWCELWKQLVPPSGEADTWQGEVLRVIANAEDEANRNGFINWDAEDDREMDLFVEKLCGDDTFDSGTKQEIQACSERIKLAANNSQRPLPRHEDWRFLHFRAVDWCDSHPQPLPLHTDEGYLGHD